MSEYRPKVGDRVRIAKSYGGTYGGKEGVVTEVSKETGTVFVKLDGIDILRDEGGAGAFGAGAVELVAYRPKVGDRVRVVLEGEVTSTPSYVPAFRVADNAGYTWIQPQFPHVVSVEKIEPGAVLPDGLTISEDGSHLNWLGENYVRQPVDEPVEVFGPGDVVLSKGPGGEKVLLGRKGYMYFAGHKGHWGDFVPYEQGLHAEHFTSAQYEKVEIG